MRPEQYGVHVEGSPATRPEDVVRVKMTPARLEELRMDMRAGWAGYDSFGARLFALITKADAVNLERLRLGFPEHVAVYEQHVGRRSVFDVLVVEGGEEDGSAEGVPGEGDRSGGSPDPSSP